MKEKKVMFYSGDAAGKNIAAQLGRKGVKNIVEVKEEILHLKGTSHRADLLIVASRHSSESGARVLTAHSPGNYAKADYGGNTCELGYAPAQYLSAALTFLSEERDKRGIEYDVCFEATHHGPTSLKAQVMFMEVGSDKDAWDDLDACSAVAESIERLLRGDPLEKPTAIGFGGGHYCRKFSKVQKYALGHICPKHSLQHVDSGMLAEMVEKTVPRPEVALVEKKGLGQEKQRICMLLEESELEVEKV